MPGQFVPKVLRHVFRHATIAISWNRVCPDPVYLEGLHSVARRSVMQIKKHDRSHMVELRDGSAWRTWPGDIPKTLQWLPTTEIDVADIEDEICSHALIDRSNGSRVRVITNRSENFDEQSGSPMDRFLREFGAPPLTAETPGGRHPPRLVTTQGSGFFISADGYAVTNDHVIEGSKTAEIQTDDQKSYTAKVVGSDP